MFGNGGVPKHGWSHTGDVIAQILLVCAGLKLLLVTAISGAISVSRSLSLGEDFTTPVPACLTLPALPLKKAHSNACHRISSKSMNSEKNNQK